MARIKRFQAFKQSEELLQIITLDTISSSVVNSREQKDRVPSLLLDTI